MERSRDQGAHVIRYPPEASELSQEVFTILHKADKTINPITIVATVDSDGTPRTAPFGSLRAVTPKLLRLVSWRGHGTYTNLCRDGHVMVSLLAPPNIAISVRGRARVIKERMNADVNHAIVEIDIEEVKNDMVRKIVIETPVTASILKEHQEWFQAVLGEAEEI